MSDAQKFVDSLSAEQKQLFLSALQGGPVDIDDQNVKDQKCPPMTKMPSVRKSRKRSAPKPVQKSKSTKPARKEKDSFTTGTRQAGTEVKERVAVSFKKNIFRDNKKLAKGEVTPPLKGERVVGNRHRPAPEYKKVRCHVCQKDFKLPVSSIYGEFFRCDRCGEK